ncbi:S8 family serine peptidase [Streptomyces sp. NBC_00053]|uniref:S8 family serine peptidase n=1 Tax=unclassified Streptomyces TaxID=2593676 RepID=UPI0019D2B923|nr:MULTISPECIES: S8 family serine peptidase [unclassified Streptomyces]MCX4396625.1 S8 family serine peptidase [Streptomyces sp. NBC_01767]MCX5100727.1 S8 family serine peptidase [Streptomyces sp. NBC_00439]MCX5160248.1 S8 family serine peptidase [Streptomyces sp. NBC_00305]MCX5218771.1 S8 family serine peptidase [Streptomyces sp. NBC_00264]MCX5500509.1 S8 family serine peptidase [Streptomyces sp. NBC_00052]
MLMTSESPSSIPGARRAARVAAAAGLVAALAATGVAPVFAADAPDTAPVKSAATEGATANKLGTNDEQLLAKAKAKGQKNVTMMVATAPGATEQVAKQLDAVKGSVLGRAYDKLGYVRATVPTATAEATIRAAAKLPSVHGIDLKQEIKLDDPTPTADRATGAKVSTRSTGSYPAPGKKTPAKNPYNPSFETGAVDFVQQHPKADGRGVTIGVLDSGVDLGHPALQKTTTGARKIVDWVTATDPVSDDDGTWLRMTDAVSGPTFTYKGSTYKAPEGDYRIKLFAEAATKGGDMAGDLNRDGDTTDVWAVLYDPVTGTTRVDLNNNADFSDDTVLKPYKEKHQVSYFGKDDPRTDVAERIPFVVETRKDVVYNAAGDTSDFVSIGVIESEHGTHVAGITAANGLFGGKMNGAAPGAKIVSSRACTWDGGCTNIALTEGMIDLVVNRGVDVVNMSIGGLPPLNDGNNARAELYKRLIDIYGVQLVISAGNDGPGVNTIGDPGLADHVISVGASISKETWASNYGSNVTKKYDMLPFSSRGPREDGGFAPILTAPGASINTTQTWLPGGPVKESGYSLPAGYSMLQGTSMASPQAAGATALLLSAAKQKHIELPPADLRSALTSTATHIKGVPAHAQGSGLIDIVGAWKQIEKQGTPAHEYSVKAPVDTAIDFALKTPGFGTGLYDREGGLKAGQKKSYDVTITRTTGPDKAVKHKLSWKNNDGTFKLTGPSTVSLPLGKPVTVKVQAKPGSAGVHSAILKVDDSRTAGVDQQILTTVVVSTKLVKPGYAFKASGSVQRNSTESYFLTVPEGAKTLEVAMSALRSGSQTRFISIHPYGVQMEDSGTPFCYPNYENPANTCRPDVRSYKDPQAGVWEIEVEARRTSPLLDNPYKLDVSLLGATFDPTVQTIAEAKIGTPASVNWKVTNNAGPLEGKLKGGSLGSAKVDKPSIKTGDTQEYTVTIGEGVEKLDVNIGGTADANADLDLYVYKGATEVGKSTTAGSEEAVSLAKPAAGTYTVVIDGYDVPAGTTTYDYRDVYYTPSLGTIKVDESKAVNLANGASAQIGAEVSVAAAAPEGRQFFGEVHLVNGKGSPAGTGSVVIEKVTQ